MRVQYTPIMTRVRLFTLDDVAFGLHLSRQAGWNQLEADWRRCLRLAPDGCFVAELDGVRAGTTTTCIFGDAAWIGMVLVENELRRRGIGEALMRHALDYLDGKEVRAIWLDATALGRPLYEKLGFVEQEVIGRHGGVPRFGEAAVALGPLRSESCRSGGAAGSGDPGRAQPVEVRPLRSDDIPAITEMDRAVLGYDRRALLQALEPDLARVTCSGERLTGFLFARLGANAWQIGSCTAERDVGGLLLQDAWQRFAGQKVYVDVPVQNQAAVAAVQAAGLKLEREFSRMRREPLGRALPCAPGDGDKPAEMSFQNQHALLWTAFGPEKG